MMNKKSIIIKECGEELVDLKKFCPRLVIALDKERMENEKTAYLRLSVAMMLKTALGYLPQGMTFIIRDAWRPQYVQENIKSEFIERFGRMHPEWNRARVLLEVSKYVADSKGLFASGHMTGGAVDLRLMRNGRRLPMRSRKLTYQQNANPLDPVLPEYLRRNRSIMFEALLKAGLSQYDKEFWHWSYGDVQWAKRMGKKVAIYGVLTEPR